MRSNTLVSLPGQRMDAPVRPGQPKSHINTAMVETTSSLSMVVQPRPRIHVELSRETNDLGAIRLTRIYAGNGVIYRSVRMLSFYR